MKLGCLFPGQGSQKVGMGRDLYDALSFARERFQQADECLGFELSAIMFNGPMEDLTQTVYAQPAIFLTSSILFDVLREKGVNVHALAGHSLGELTAYYAGGVLSFEDCLNLIRFRATVMGEAYPSEDSAMTAVLKLSLEDVQQKVADIEDVVVANINCPGQVVISGKKQAVLDATEALKSVGAKSIPLPVSGAFHSPLMRSASERLADYMESVTIQDSHTPIYLNRTAEPVVQADVLRKNVSLQVISSVQWTSSVECMARDVSQFMECGFGRVLAGLVKKILPDCQSFVNVNNIQTLESYLTESTEVT